MKLAAIGVAVAVALVLAACGPGERKPPDKPKLKIIEADWVQLCLDEATALRQPDFYCELKNSPFIKVYIHDVAPWPREIPAVGQRLDNGRWWREQPESFVTVPPEGALFPKR